MTGDELPRIIERPHGSTLMTRAELAELLGYSTRSLASAMGRHPQRWPRPAAMIKEVGARQWSLVWDRDEVLAVAPPATADIRRGGTATISGPDGLIACLECGQRFRSLGRHLASAHDVDAATYRERHRLPATAALSADGVRERSSRRQLDRLAEDPDALAHLAPGRTPERLDAMREVAIERHRETVNLPLVREHRAPGQAYAVQVMLSRRRDRLDAIARDAGWDGLDAAITATAHLPAPRAAAQIGVGASTVRRHRQRLAVQE